MWPEAVLLVLSVAFRLPALLNAGSVDSDSAIVGLQAMHLLHGEWSPFLLGSGYQTSVDSAVAAAFFVFFGPTPLALMLSTFAGHLVLTWLAFATLRRHLPPWTAALLVLPLVFTPSPLHTYILGPPRQASLTLVFLAVWLLDGASRAKRPPLHCAAGAAVASLASFADPYALLFAPALALLAGLACFDEPRLGWRTRAGASAAGFLVGAVPLILLWRSPHAAHGEVKLTSSVVAHNWGLLRDACGPWILSTTAFGPRLGIDYGPWSAPLPIRLVQLVGAVTFVGGILSAGAAAFVRSIPWELRRLGLFGFVMLPLTLAGFLTSVMVMDLFSTRYLAALVLASPFALAPLAGAIGWRRFAAALAPYVASAAIAGWLGFGTFVDGPLPVVTARGQGRDERRLEEALASHGVTRAMADYWVSYRVTFLSRERLEVVPLQPELDRYTPYRAALGQAEALAYIFDPRRSRESFDAELGELEQAGSGYDVADRVVVGELVAVVLRRVRSASQR